MQEENVFIFYLIDDLILIDEELKNTAFEVYGIVGGQPGWTEIYSWIHKGNWVDPIEKYLRDLSEEIRLYDEEIEQEKQRKRLKETRKIEDQVEKFNKIFI